MNSNPAGIFDFSGIDPKNTVVRCESQDEADVLIQYLVACGLYNQAQAKHLSAQWERYNWTSCYHLVFQSWCYDSWYEQNSSYKIVNFRDVYKVSQADVCDVTYSYDELFS